MHGQIGQPDDEDGALRRYPQTRHGGPGERYPAQGADGKERTADEEETGWTQQPRESDEAPQGEERQAGVERRVEYWRHRRCYADARWIIIELLPASLAFE